MNNVLGGKRHSGVRYRKDQFGDDGQMDLPRIVKVPNFRWAGSKIEKADLKSAFGVCPHTWGNHPLHFIRNPLWPRSLRIEGFPGLCFLPLGLNPFEDSHELPNPIHL